MPRLSGKLCVVTGAARGIGAAIATAFVNEGATVILTDIDEGTGRATADGLSIPFHRLDVSSEGDWTAFAAIYPQIDVLVNNAGITGFEGGPRPHDPEAAALDDWRRVMAVNLDGCFLGCRYAIGAMKARVKGSIINLSSRSGMVGIPGAAAYAASKAGIRNHTKTVALYCAEQGWAIRCNSIHPGAILTPMWDAVAREGPEREENLAAFVADTPLRRFGKPGEVAALAVLLASDEATYITGAELTIDGGLLAGTAVRPSA